MGDNESGIVRCYSCGNWVRIAATSLEPTGERSDMERWCFGCINDVDAYTDSLEDWKAAPNTFNLDEGDEE